MGLMMIINQAVCGGKENHFWSLVTGHWSLARKAG